MQYFVGCQFKGELLSRAFVFFDQPDLDRLAQQICQPAADLSGSFVASDKPVAVFASNKNAMVPFFMFGTEHIEEQVPSTATWGKVAVARLVLYFSQATVGR